MERRKTITVYPWSLSVTGLWNAEKGIYNLRDETAKEIAEWFGEVKDLVVIDSGLTEIVAHGNPRKSAEVVRLLVKKHPEMERGLKGQLGMEIYDFFTKGDLEDIPSKPSEYSGNSKVEYMH